MDNIIDFSEFKGERESKEQCKHKTFTYNDDGYTVSCNQCRKTVTLVMLISESLEFLDEKIDRVTKKLELIEKFLGIN